MAGKATAVFDFIENDDCNSGAEEGQKGLADSTRRASTRTRPSVGMAKGTIGSRNVAAATGNFNKKQVHQTFLGPGGRVSSQGPASRPLKQPINGELGSGMFFGGPVHDGPRRVGVSKARTNGKGVEGGQARKLRAQDDDEIADVTPPETRPAVRGDADAAFAKSRRERQDKRRRQEDEQELAPNSDVESEEDAFGKAYRRVGSEKKAEVTETGETGGKASDRGWRTRDTKRRRASEGGEVAQDEMPPEKKSRAGQHNGRKQADPEYKQPSSRCAVRRAPHDARKAKGKAEVINLDSEETPHKDTPDEASHREAAPRRLDLEPPVEAGPSMDQDKTYVTGRCWLGTFSAERCSVFFDASRLRVTVPRQYVRGGADGMTFAWDMDNLASGKSFRLEADAKDSILVTFQFKGLVHPSLAPYLDPKSTDLHACTVGFEVDLAEWKHTQSFAAWPTGLKEHHFGVIRSQDLPKYTDGRPTENKALLDPEAQPRPTAAAAASRHFTRSVLHPKPSIKTFHFPLNDPDAVTISTSDLARLEPLEFLNDTLIDFYIKFLQEANFSAEHKERIHIVNSFFFKKLTETAQEARKRGAKREEAFRRMNKWTRKVNIFEKSYLIVPVNQSLHWSLAIVVYPGGGDAVNGKLESGREMRTPCILQLDSMAGGHANVEELLRTYLTELWLSTHPREERPAYFEPLSRFSRAEMPFIQVKVPQQDNHCDCGLFLLHYVEKFIANPPPIFDRRQGSNGRKGLYQMTPRWFQPEEVSYGKRDHLRGLILRLADQLGRGNTSILEPDTLKALWIDVVGIDAENRDAARRTRQGSGEANRAPAEGATGREKSTGDDRGNGGRNGLRVSSRMKAAASADRDRKERPVLTSAYDELDDDERSGKSTGRKKPLSADDLDKVLNEEAPGGSQPDTHLSFIVDASPLQKRKPGVAVAADGERDQGEGQTDLPSSEEQGDPLGYYRRFAHLTTPKTGKAEPAIGGRPTTTGGVPNNVGKEPAGNADVSRVGDKDSVPDSEDEEEPHRVAERGRSEPEASGKAGTRGNVDVDDRTKRATSNGSDDSRGFESDEGSPDRDGITEHGRFEGSGRSSREESPAVASADLRLKLDGSDDRGSDSDRSLADASDGRGLGSDRQRSGDMGSDDFPEQKTLQEGPQAEAYWAADARPGASRGGSESRENGGWPRDNESEKQLVVHPAVGEFPDSSDFSDTEKLPDTAKMPDTAELPDTADLPDTANAPDTAELPDPDIAELHDPGELGGEAVSDGEGLADGGAHWDERQHETWHETEGVNGVERGREHGTRRGGWDKEALREKFGASRGHLGATEEPWGEEPSGDDFEDAAKSPRLLGRETRGQQQLPLETRPGAVRKEDIRKGVARAVSGKEAGKSSAPEEIQSAFSEELSILGRGAAYKWNGVWGVGSPRPEVGGRNPPEQDPRSEPSVVERETDGREPERSGGKGAGERVRKSKTENIIFADAGESEVEFVGSRNAAGVDGTGFFARSGRKVPGREHLRFDESSRAKAEEGGAVATQSGRGPRNRSPQEILQHMQRPKDAEGVGVLASEKDDAGFDRESRRGTVLTSEQIRRLDALEGRMNHGAKSEDETTQGRDWHDRAEEAAAETAEQPKKIDVMRAKACELLLGSANEPPTSKSGKRPVTEARNALEEPVRSTRGLAAGETSGDRLASGLGSRLVQDEGSPEGSDGDREPISQELFQEDGESGGHGSPRGELDGWEDQQAKGRETDGADGERTESTARRSGSGRDSLPEREEDSGNDEALFAGDSAEVSARKRQKTAPDNLPEADVQMLDAVPGARGALQSQKGTGRSSVQPNGIPQNGTPLNGLRNRPVDLEAEDSRGGAVRSPYFAIFGTPGVVGTRVAATQGGPNADRRSPRKGGERGDSVERKAADGADRFAKGLASREKTDLVQRGFVVQKEGQTVKTTDHRDDPFPHPTDTDSPVKPKNTKSLKELLDEGRHQDGNRLRGSESWKAGRGGPATGLTESFPEQGSLKQGRLKTPAQVVSLDSDEEDAEQKEDRRHTKRAMRSTRAEIKSQERKKSFEEDMNRRKSSRLAS